MLAISLGAAPRDGLQCQPAVYLMPEFVNEGSFHPLTESVLALSGTRGDEVHIGGSAFIVAPGLAITAKHVLEDYVLHFERCEPSAAPRPLSFRLFALQGLPDRGLARAWMVKRQFLSGYTDVALLELVPIDEEASRYQWNLPRIGVDSPPVGSKVMGFGYRKASIRLPDAENNLKHMEWTDIPTTTSGEVVEIHPRGRDQRIYFPCFRTDARFDGGMSGGPLFSQDGVLRAVISSNLPPFKEGESHVSYGALFWPALTTTLSNLSSDLPAHQDYPLAELAKVGKLRVAGWERVVLPANRGDPIRLLTAQEYL